MRRAKIVCTLGPATTDLVQLIDAGMNVARFNLSHGSYAEHEARYRQLREATDITGKAVGALADLQGPKIRLGVFHSNPSDLVAGELFTITTQPHIGDCHMASTTYQGLPQDVRSGDTILIDDGRVQLEVVSVSNDEVRTQVIVGGPVSDHKGINLPGIPVSVPALTEKDRRDLIWALQMGFDMVALSFVRSAQDIVEVHEVMDEVGIRVPVLAKIEKPQAIDDLHNIIDTFDGIMVARGDLGVELPLEEVPIVQKRTINMCRDAGKPVIVATQMLDSMITSSQPTRAEVSDVANAVLDGTSAVMLSGETSVGEHPIHVVETMARIIVNTEQNRLVPLHQVASRSGDVASAVATAATGVADAVDATYICCFTETGRSVRLIARQRSETPILAFTPHDRTRSQLSLVWGVETFIVPPVNHTDDMVRQVEAELLRLHYVEQGQRVIMIAGVPPGSPGTTNGLRVHEVGHGRFDGV